MNELEQLMENIGGGSVLARVYSAELEELKSKDFPPTESEKDLCSEIVRDSWQAWQDAKKIYSSAMNAVTAAEKELKEIRREVVSCDLTLARVWIEGCEKELQNIIGGNP